MINIVLFGKPERKRNSGRIFKRKYNLTLVYGDILDIILKRN
jgi:hypothetical protein